MGRAAEATRPTLRRARAPRNGRAAVLVGMALVAALAPYAEAQQRDAPLPPRLDRPTVPAAPTPIPSSTTPSLKPAETGATPPTAPGGLVRPPNAARLAPLPGQRGDDIEEIVVLGGNWRLPDLGSAWRARQQAAELGDGPHVTFVPLYDPERPTTFNDTFLLNREMSRVGYIDLFRVRFGRRDDREEE